MARVILVCGKICCGKTTYAEKLAKDAHAAVLSCDDVTLALFPDGLGAAHDEMTVRVKRYLLERATALLALDVNVLLEWGFWQKAERAAVRSFFEQRGVETELHYVHVAEAVWRANIEKRAELLRENPSSAYGVDVGLAEKCAALFEEPAAEEVDVWYENAWR